MMRLNFIALTLAFGIAIGEGSSCTSWYSGTCQNYKHNVCLGGYKRGLCSGNSDIRCCLPCSSTCRSNENYYSNFDGRCTSANGKCMTDTNYCPSNSWRSSMCGGPSSRKCCLSGGSNSGRSTGTCTLRTFSASNVKGYNGRTIRVDGGFYNAMEDINTYARQCGVVVQVTSSFRKQNVPVSGAIVTPASRSNHKVGHAIDMNLQYGGSWCNSACLQAHTKSKVSCFINKIRADSNLRWGGDFNTKDPVHIDDALNIKNRNGWDDLYRKLQRYCSS